MLRMEGDKSPESHHPPVCPRVPITVVCWSFPLEKAPAMPALGPAGVSLLPHSLWPRGDPSPRRGEAPEETLLWLQQMVPSRGQHLGRGARALWAVHRPAHRRCKCSLFMQQRPKLVRLLPRERLLVAYGLYWLIQGWVGKALPSAEKSDHADRRGGT